MSETPKDDLIPDDPKQDEPKEELEQQDPKPDDKPKDRYKEDLLKTKAAFKDLEAEVANLRKEKEDARIASMREKEQFKELAEEYKLKLESAETRQEELNKAIVLDKKYSAIKEAALQMGIRKEALIDLDLLNMENVEIETTSTGRVNILNAKEFVEDLKVTKPHWFGRRSTSLNSNDPVLVPEGGKVTVDMIRKAEQEAKKSGDSSTYLTLVKRYKQQ